jgi:hypothetical protein
MEELVDRINQFEIKVESSGNSLNSFNLKEMLVQAGIFESLAEFYNSEQLLEKLEKLKKQIQSKSNWQIYSTVAKRQKIEIINKRIEHIAEFNELVYENTLDQAPILDMIRITEENLARNIEQENEQLLTYVYTFSSFFLKKTAFSYYPVSYFLKFD